MSHIHKHHKLGITFILNVLITVAQVIGGLISGSLALISDALHNLSDSMAVLLAYVADRIADRKKTTQSTFGFRRAEILAAFINGLVLVAVSFYLIVEAVGRFIDPTEVDFRWMFGLGLVGLIANTLSVFILHSEKDSNLNIKAAYLHLLGDALTSMAVIVGAVFIWYFQWYWIDPLITLFISFYLIFQTYQLLKESTGILMQFGPPNVDPVVVGERLLKVEGVRRVYHIHIWRLTDKTIHFEGHVVLTKDLKISETKEIHDQMIQILKDEFLFQHLTFQFEYV
ncbi:cation diffusion facilitator family transporter [Sunxiuqinia sp. A32]|uniref:cation diffusion facilitator family transporter n=1 Tax=Sunxiuqinia sp. A32 TaxID=3461496 RepID=UPI004045DAF8